jgi:alpha-tubulin suppressor-like RCC1 family protein
MPIFYNYTENGVVYSFDDVFIPADAFRQGNLWIWGWNGYGQLGINVSGFFSSSHRCTPVTTFAGGSNWKQVAYGGTYVTAAIKTDGTLWNWGQNSWGGLGINSSGNVICTPVTTFAGGTNWKSVGCSEVNVAAIKTDGTLWTWGFNYYGNIGDNTITARRITPVTTFAGGTNWKQVAGGYAHFAAIKTDGTLWVWGYNNNGQLGINDTTNRCTPVTTFAGGTNWKQVSAARFHTEAIKTDGTLWTWGYNNNGQLGINDTTNRATPVTTFAGGTNWKQVACSEESITAAIKTDGTLWTWGNNAYGYLDPGGALGVNDIAIRCTPVTTFAGGTNWKQVSCSGRGNVSAIEYIDSYQ